MNEISTNNNFLILLWKNWLILIRHRLHTCIAFFLPFVLVLIIVCLRSKNLPVEKAATTYPVLLLDRLDNYTNTSGVKMEIIYFPDCRANNEFMHRVGIKLGLPIKATNSMQELEDTHEKENLFLAIIFDLEGFDFKLGGIYTRFQYIFRYSSEINTNITDYLQNNWMTNLLYPLFPFNNPRAPHETGDFFKDTYLAVQFRLNYEIMIAHLGYLDSMLFFIKNITIQRFPYPAYKEDPFLSEIQMSLSFVILLGYIYISVNTIKFITAEKEKKLTNRMKSLGISCLWQWFAWFLMTVLVMFVSTALVVLLLKIHVFADPKVSVLTFSSVTALMAFFLIYSMATATFCLMISAFFSKTNAASPMAGFVSLMFYLPYMATQNNYLDRRFLFKTFISLFHNSAMGLHFKLVLMHEAEGKGLQWSNIFKPVSVLDDFSIGYVWLMLILDNFIYLAIGLFIEGIISYHEGGLRPWNFIFKKQFWIGNYASEKTVDEFIESIEQNNEYVEQETDQENPTIEIINLRKIYRDEKVAVHGLSLNIYENQIIVLLGETGAGKSTTISILAGILPSTSGIVIVNGKSFENNEIGLRTSFGLCPQENFCFDELTIRENFIFFCQLRGVNSSKIYNDIEKYDKLLELEMNNNKSVALLSTGMKRKLGIAVALCVGSRVVLCDEPSLGADPLEQRIIWNVLQQEKKGRTIIVTTKCTNEAELFGDRIAIMSAGKLKCCGTSFYLKKRLGVGYHLTCSKTEGFRIKILTKLLKKYVPTTNLEYELDSDLSYQISERYLHNFSPMLLALDDHQKCLGISSYGLSFTTLEDVLMRVYCNVPDKLIEIYDGSLVADEKSSECEMESEDLLLNGVQLFISQIEAMIYKKIIYAYRTSLLFLVQNAIPFLFVLLAFSTIQSFAPDYNWPPLKLGVDVYRKSTYIISFDPENANSNLDPHNEGHIPQACQKVLDRYNTKQEIDVEMTNKPMSEFIDNVQKTNLLVANEKYLFGLEIKKQCFVVYYNNRGYHAAPAALMMYYKCIFARACRGDCHINVIYHPFPYRESTRLKMIEDGHYFGHLLAINIGFAMALVSAVYIIFYIKERESRAKFLQFVSGLDVFIYWITAFIWDLFTFAISSLVPIFTLLVLEEFGFRTNEELERCFVLLMAFGWAVLPLHYLASELFSKPSLGFTCMALFNLLTGVVIFMANSQAAIGMYSPYYLVSHSLNNISLMISYNKLCIDTCLKIGKNCTNFEYLCNTLKKEHCCDFDYMNSPKSGLKHNITSLLIIGTILFVIVLIKDIFMFRFINIKCFKNLFKNKKKPQKRAHFIDQDILTECSKVAQMDLDEISYYNLVIKEFSKYDNCVLAIDNMSLAIKHSEIFGLFGMDGAGKSTVLKTLMGEKKMNDGEAWVFGINLREAIRQMYHEVGYCPDVDAFIDDLSGKEILKIFCLIRGVERRKIDKLSIYMAAQLDFLKDIDKIVKMYSDENKRKLSIALALIGSPSVVYLDEPTAKMNIQSRHLMWKIFGRVRRSGKSIILATSSMNECEAICTRMTILAGGELKCIGTPQHMIHKYSKGLYLIIKPHKVHYKFLRDSCVDAIKENQQIKDMINNYINRHLTEATLKDDNNGLLTYVIFRKINWPILFAMLEAEKYKLKIEDYIISQFSLEQLFREYDIRNYKNYLNKKKREERMACQNSFFG